jgi:pimeloyl-ACP methyl ester carboxylesterase
MSHTPPITLNTVNKTIARYSLAPPKNLIVFVHGFAGTSTGTWDDFLIRINNRGQKYDYSDVIFYGYPSLSSQAANHAVDFKEFLLKEAICPWKRNDLNKRNISDDFKYKKIVLVAHSLGAVVVRKALFLLKKDGSNSMLLRDIKMVLFAPAHYGTLLTDQYFTKLPELLGIVATLGILHVPVFKNLQTNSSIILNLVAETQKYIESKDGDFTKADRVIWAAQERVVVNEFFCDDPEPIVEKETDHTSVCKLKLNTYMFPLGHVHNSLV